MQQQHYRAIGMMSGTSLDGVDLTYCHYHHQGQKWTYEMVSAQTYPYPQDMLACIRTLINQETTFLTFKKKEIEYSQFIAKLIQRFIQEHSVTHVDYLALHGHTIFHNPAEKVTVQALNLNTVAAITGLDVIGNFRQLDVMRGGEGAPLAPFGEDIFSADIFINLGGVANIGCGQRGWDITLCNLVLNHYASEIEGKDFDQDGHLGREGNMDPQVMPLLQATISNQQRKSLGRQLFEQLITKVNSTLSPIKAVNILTTFYHFLAKQITQNIDNAIKESQMSGQCRVLCTGGGSHNKFLQQLLHQYSGQGVQFLTPTQSLIDFKEAIIFGILGAKFMIRRQSCSQGIGGMLVKGYKKPAAELKSGQ